MLRMKLPTSQLPISAENLRHHFDAVTLILERLEPLKVGLYEHALYGTHPGGWLMIFGRQRTRIRCRYSSDISITIQQADAPPDEWYPDWSKVPCEEVEFREHSEGPYSGLTRILRERFST
jgi:hypothetical protein